MEILVNTVVDGIHHHCEMYIKTHGVPQGLIEPGSLFVKD
jgi:hypothetical protein